MNVYDIVTLAMSLGANQGDETLLVPLCQAAVDDLSRRLKGGLRPEDCSPAFEIAAAWLAMDHLEAAGGQVSGFSAGEVSFDMDGGGLGLRQRAERLMAPYVAEKTFAFVGVKG